MEPRTASDEEAVIECIDELLSYATLQVCAVGAKLIATGEDADCFYYVTQGVFEVSHRVGRTPIVVALIGAGEFFGEIGFFDRLPRTRDIRAREAAQVRIFDREVMARISAEKPRLHAHFLEYLLRSVCGRFRQVLADRGPLTAYAASLSTGREQFQGLQPLPADLMNSADWRELNAHIEEFKAGMFDVTYQLQREAKEDIDAAIAHRGNAILDAFKEKVRSFGPVIERNQNAALLWGYLFKEVFPYLMRSRFAERAYYKPKGFAGDYWMIELIYRNQPDGDGKLGKLIDAWALRQVPAKAVRARRDLLKRLLDRLCRERLGQGRVVRIMNLACGPSRELSDLLVESEYGDDVEALCIDIDPEALQYAHEHVLSREHPKTSVRFMNENVIKWALGRVKHDFGAQDIIYSSGLCDYLDDRLFAALIKRAFQQLKPGGVFIVGNFSPANPDRFFMDHILYWRLLHRGEKDLRRLFAQSPFGESISIVSEEEGVNLFVVASRPYN
jgi:SAM-dependent methyltransferase